MTEARYLPAAHTQARSLPLGPLSIRTADDRELGRLMGFVIGPEQNHISRLVLEVVTALAPGSVAHGAAPLRCRGAGPAHDLCRNPPDERVRGQTPSPQIDEADLWVPLFSSAA